MREEFYLARRIFGTDSTYTVRKVDKGEPILRTEEDVEAVLRLAVRHESAETTPDLRARLEQTAAELGLSRESLEAAEAQYREDLAQRSAQEARALAWKKYQLDRVKNFLSHLASYIAVNAGLIAMDWLPDGRLHWAYWPLMGWGIGILSDAASTFLPNKETRKRFEKRERRREAQRAMAYSESSSSSDPSSTR